MSKFFFIILLLIIISFTGLISQQIPNSTVTVLNNPNPGYLLVGPWSDSHLMILDNNGKPAYMKPYSFNNNAQNVDVQTNGLLTFFDNQAMCFVAIDTNFNSVDSIRCDSNKAPNFHQFKILPNGHYLMLSYEIRRMDLSKIIANGQIDATIYGNVIQELDENKNLAFQWSSLDHFQVTDATDDIDLTAHNIDLTHCNSVDYSSDGNLILSTRHFDEITKINRQTGQIIWRLGGSKCKNNQFRFLNDTINGFFGFSHQHDCIVLSNGNYLMFDNGNLKTAPYSRAVEYRLDEANTTVSKVWDYRHSPDVFGENMGSVQRFDDGSTLIGWGGNSSNLIATEVKSNGQISFEMQATLTIATYRVKRSIYKMAAVTKRVSQAGTYNFSDSKYQTAISLIAGSLTGSGRIWIEKHSYTSRNNSFSETAPCGIHPYRWVVSKDSINSLNGTIKFNLAQISDFALPSDLSIYYRSTEGTGNFAKLTSTYNASAKTLQADFPGFGEFILCNKNLIPTQAIQPVSNAMGVAVTGKLSWIKYNDNDDYDLVIADNPGFNPVADSIIGLQTNSYSYSDLSNNKKYYWKVHTRNGACGSDWSDTWAFTTIVGTPSLVSPQDLATDRAIADTIKWNPVTGADSYHVEISETSDFKSLVVDKVNVITPWTTYSGLKYFTGYFWRVNAKDSIYTGNWSQVRMFTTKLPPVVLLLPDNDSTGVSITANFSWNKINSAQSYNLQLSKQNDFSNAIIDSNIVNPYLVLSGLEYYTKYYWRVKGTNTSSKGEWSSVWSFTSVLQQPRIVFPSDNSVNALLNGYISWVNIKDAAGYHIQISQNIDFKTLIFDSSGVADTVFNYKNLSVNTKYYCRVTAYNDRLTTDWSEVSSFLTRVDSYIPQTVLSLPPKNTLNRQTADYLQWILTEGAVGYQLQIALTNDFANPFIDSVIKFSSKFNYSNFSYNTVYYWKIKALGKQSNAVWSAVWSFTTVLQAPEPDSPAINTTEVKVQGKLTWKASPGATSYKVQLSEHNDFSLNVIDTFGINTIEINYINLKGYNTYYWRVKGMNGAKESNWSETWNFKTGEGTKSVQQARNFKEVDFINYPNPLINSTNFEFHLSESTFVTLKIFNEFGSEIGNIIEAQLPAGKYKFSWEPRDESDGVYFYRFNAGVIFRTGNLILLR